MKKILIVVLALVVLTIGLPSVVLAIPTLTTYPGDAPGWRAAVVNYETEFFNDATLEPEVSFTTDVGYVHADKYWCDQITLPDYGDNETIWHFATPITAFGGDWDLRTGGPGTALKVYINESWVLVGEIPNSYSGEFWGFVSSEPFTDVLIDHGSNIVAWAETYHMDNMVYSFQRIDIKPGNFPNSINLKSKGVIPVAILTTPSFDATTVDASTVTFGPDAATMVHKSAHLEDVDGDGDIDMVLHFKTQKTGIQASDTEATLTGETVGGVAFEGTDTVNIVPKGKTGK